MKKQFLVLFAMVFEIAAMGPHPEDVACAMVMALGLAMNGLAVIGNGEKMPVVGLGCETPHHRPVTANTRYMPLIDRIQTPIGVHSIGDFLLEASLVIYLLGSAARLLVVVST